MLVNLYCYKKIITFNFLIFNNLIQFFWYFKKNINYINTKKIIKFKKTSNFTIQSIFFINNRKKERIYFCDNFINGSIP